MGRGVKQTVRTGKDGQAVSKRLAGRQQRLGVRGDPGGERQDRVVDIDHPVALAMDQRGQLVHPAAIIGIVIGIGLHPFPAGGEQGGLCFPDPVAGDQNVQIADVAAHRGRKPGGSEGGALEQNDRHAQRRQRPPGHLGLPERGQADLPGRGDRVVDQALHRGGERQAVQPVGQRARHLLGPGHSEELGPFPRSEIHGEARRAQHMGQAPAGRHASASTRAMPLSVSG